MSHEFSFHGWCGSDDGIYHVLKISRCGKHLILSEYASSDLDELDDKKKCVRVDEPNEYELRVAVWRIINQCDLGQATLDGITVIGFITCQPNDTVDTLMCSFLIFSEGNLSTIEHLREFVFRHLDCVTYSIAG